jgi:hypothetical protein
VNNPLGMPNSDRVFAFHTVTSFECFCSKDCSNITIQINLHEQGLCLLACLGAVMSLLSLHVVCILVQEL